MEGGVQESSSWSASKIALMAAGVFGVAGAVYLGATLWGSNSKYVKRQGLKQAKELYNKAIGLKEVGDWEQAEEKFTEALHLLHINLADPNNDENIARCLHELSICSLNNSKEVEAEKYALECVEILTSNHGEDSPELLDALINLAGILIARKKLIAAEEQAHRAKMIIEGQDEFNHGAMSAVYRVLSGVNVSKKELDEAARLANLALSEFNQADITDPQLRYRHQLECYMLLGKIYSKQEKDEQAEEAYITLVEVAKKELGENDLEVAMTLRHLGEYYEIHKSLKRAEKRHLEAIEVVRKKFGNDDSNLFAFINYLAHFYWDHKMDNKANELCEELKEMKCLPTPSVSKFLVTKLFAFTFNRSPTNPFYVVPLYVGELVPTASLPRNAFLEVEFENPANPGKPIIIDQPLGDYRENIVVVSPPVTGVKPRMYEIVIRIYKDDTRAVKLGEHHQMCQSVFDTDKIRTEDDLFKQIPKDSFLQE